MSEYKPLTPSFRQDINIDVDKLNDLASDYGLVVGGYQQEEEGMLQLLMVKAIGEEGEE